MVDANIQVTPDGVNRVGQNHTFTGHVNVNNGTGQVNAPDGTTINFTVNNAARGSCTTAGGTGSCSLTLTSAMTGVWAVRASTTVSVGGLTLTRSTDGVAPNSGPAMKRWVNAKISIAPSATNVVGQPHTFTVTLQKDTGDGNGFVAASGEHVTVTLTDSNGAAHTAPTGTCTNGGANTDANGQCTITFNSPSAGKVTGHASSTLSVVGSAPFTVQTDGAGLNSADAVKTYVDANIQITPRTARTRRPSHVHGARQRNNAGRRVPERAGRHAISFTKTGPGKFTARTRAPSPRRPTGSCTVRSPRRRPARRVTAPRRCRSAALTITRDDTATRTRGDTGRPTRRGSTRRSRSRRRRRNPVGTTHMLTGHVNVNLGTGFVNAPAGTEITFSIVSGPGSFVGGATAAPRSAPAAPAP